MTKFRSPSTILIKGVLTGLVFSLCLALKAEEPLDPFVVAYVGDKNSSAFFLGVQQGLLEGNIQGQFWGNAIDSFGWRAARNCRPLYPLCLSPPTRRVCESSASEILRFPFSI